MRRWGTLLLAILLGGLASLLAAGCAASPDGTGRRPAGGPYYVAPDGDDTNPGTEGEPWATLQHAAELLQPGETVYVRGGLYHEAVEIAVSGSAEGGFITFTAYPGEQPILDGSGLADDPDGACGFCIEGRSYLVIQGFEIRNFTTTRRYAVPMGIQITGASHHIRLLENHIHHIETHAPLDADLLGADAHGIAVYGTETDAVHDLLIRGNEVDHLVLGSSEAVVLNGNVRAFTVTGNLIHDCDNIGLDFIGFEGTASDPALDQARDGLVSANRIYAIDTRTNPAYGGERSAAGLYVDGGREIIIERNEVFSSNLGIELASEHAGRATEAIIVRSNFIHHNHVAGLAMGGYDRERGSTEACRIINNTFWANDTDETGSGELWLQFDTRDNLIANNIFIAGTQALLIANPFVENVGNVVDDNLYFAPLGAEAAQWEWKGVRYTGFESYRAASGNDANSRFADPRLDLPTPHLLDDSPAIEAGRPLTQAGTLDFDGDPRLQGVRLDIGADEYPAPPAARLYLPLIVRRI